MALKHGPISVVHFDAHLDTWNTYFDAAYTHGTPFRRASEEGPIDVDVVEAAPAYDHAQITGIAASHIIYELLSAFAK